MKSLNYSNRARFNNLMRVCAGGLSALLLWTYLHWYPVCHADDPECHSRTSRSLDTSHVRPIETSVLAHAPGFTVLENAYWRNNTWYFVSSKKWAFPEVRHIVTNAPWYGEDIKWDDNVAQILTPQEAVDLGLEVNDVEIVQGSSVSRSI
jgi:hypothetical protein